MEVCMTKSTGIQANHIDNLSEITKQFMFMRFIYRQTENLGSTRIT